MLLRRTVTAVAAVILLNCLPADARLKLRGGPGTSIETAFIIEGATDSSEGVMTEYVVLQKRYPGWKREMQTLRVKDGRTYDVYIISKDGKTKEVWFDITSFFGK